MAKLLVAFIVLLVVPAPALGGTPLGVQDDHALLTFGRIDLIPKQARVVRINVFAGDDLRPYVEFAQRQRASGRRVYATLTGLPGTWPDIQETRRAVRALAPYAAYFTAWNEPDLRAWWRGDAGEYRRHYLRVRRAVRRYAPRARMLVGEVSPYGMDFLRRVGRVPTDGVAAHPYDSGPDDFTIETLERSKAELRAIYGRSVPLYLSEFGYHAPSPGWRMCRAWAKARRAGARLFLAYQVAPIVGHTWDTTPDEPDWSSQCHKEV